MFRRRDEEESDSNNNVGAENSSANFGSINDKQEDAPEAKKDSSTTARSIFGLPVSSKAEPQSESVSPFQAMKAKAAENSSSAASTGAPEASSLSNIFARPPLGGQSANATNFDTQDSATSKPSTYKISATGDLTPTVAEPSKEAAISSVPSFAQTNISSFKPQTTSVGNNMSNIDKIETEKRLTVGYGITLEGKISNCDKLIVYGYVNADLDDVKTLHISESGKFSGFASIENAEISGAFEGDLIVENSIVINSTGRMNGKVTYGSIEIKPGGKFTGQIVDAADADPAFKVKKSSKKKAETSSADDNFTLSAEPVESVAAQKEELFA